MIGESRSMPIGVRIGIFLVGVVLLSAPNLLQQNVEATAAILVAKNTIERGAVLNESMWTHEVVPVQYIHPFQIPVADAALLKGRDVRYGMSPGQPLLWSDLSERQEATSRLSANIPNGYRAITLPLSQLDGFGGLIEAGDSVDLWWTSHNEPKLLLASLPIAALGNALPGETRPANPRTVTFAVPEKEAQKLLRIRNRSDISFLLRNPADVTDISVGRALAELGAKPKRKKVVKKAAPKKEEVQILLGK